MSLRLDYKALKKYRLIVFTVFIFCMMASFGFFAMRGMQKSSAVSAAGFNAGNIISDAVMSNYNSMSVSDIQSFLTAKNPCNDRDYNKYLRLKASYPNNDWHFANGHFVCLSEERFGDGETIGSGQTAAEIIYQAAQDYRINPQVLLVLLQKEQGLITDTYPNKVQYRAATGFGCPDTDVCSTQYYGFKNQVRNAASMFREVLNGGWSNYPAYRTVYVQYNPNPDCGGTNVYIENRATSALYRYTPYQPNASALNAGYGTGDVCGAYGNRNFYLYFTDWFGSTQRDVWTALGTPRYFEATRDIERINPFTEESAGESTIKQGTILFYTSKTVSGGGQCLRTEHNTINGIQACVPQKYLKEIELEYQDVPQNEQYKIITSSSEKVTIPTKSIQKFTDPMVKRFPKKATFLGETYYFTEFDTALSAKPTKGFKADALTNVTDYTPISQYLITTQDHVQKLDLVSGRVQAELNLGATRFYLAKMNVNGETYYQTEYDQKNNNAGYLIKGTALQDAYSAYIPFENPRSLRLVKQADRIDPVTGAYYDTLGSGRVIEFVDKIYANGQWYYRTKHNAAHDLYFALPASATAEV